MKNKFMISGISAVLFVVVLCLVSFIDVASIGPENTSIGLSHLNEAFHNLTGTDHFWYVATEIIGYASLLLGGCMALTGLYQLVKTKSIFKVDREILLLGCLYAVMIGLYILFEFVIINYRPIIMEGDMHVEASFPSSHTMLTCVIMGSFMVISEKRIRQIKTVRIIKVVCAALMAIMISGRLICGVHWFTDILAGVLISMALVNFYAGLVE